MDHVAVGTTSKGEIELTAKAAKVGERVVLSVMKDPSHRGHGYPGRTFVLERRLGRPNRKPVSWYA